MDFHSQACHDAAAVGPPTDADRLRDAAGVLFGDGALTLYKKPTIR